MIPTRLQIHSGFLRKTLGRTWWGAALALTTAIGFGQSPIQLISLANTTWRFNDSGTDLGTAWRLVNYPADSGWPSGRALLGIEGSAPYPYAGNPIQTPLVLGGGRLTYYFRTHFTVAQNPASLLLTATAFVDDGAVFYVNGTEVARVRLPAGTVTSSTRAQLANPEGVPATLVFPTTAFVQGDNVLAVEVHQNSTTSSDVVFGLSLQAIVAIPPAITNPADPADRTVLQGRSTTLAITATGTPPPAYRWFKDNVALPGATNDSLALTSFNSSDAGSYFLVASNFAGSATSRTAVVSYLADTNPPAILYAIGLPNLTNIVVMFTEDANAFGAAGDVFNWSVLAMSDGSPLNLMGAFATNGTNVLLTTDLPRDPSTSYKIKTTTDITDAFGNAVPAGTEIPIALFETPLIAMDGTHAWRFDQSGTDRGSAWTNAAYDDSAWSNGVAVFDGYRGSPDDPPLLCRSVLPANGETVRTCLTLSNSAGTAQLPAAYFRAHFQFEGDAAYSVLRLRMLIDDGAALYLNGAEIARRGLPAGSISYQTLASRSVADAGYEDIEISAPGLVSGDNVLAVEVHQDSLISPDLTFGLRLTGVVPALAARPRLAVEQSGGNIVLAWTPAVGSLEAADEVGGPWTIVIPSDPPNHHLVALDQAPRKFYRVVVP